MEATRRQGSGWWDVVAEKPLLWGLTCRLAIQFLEIVAELLPAPAGEPA